MLTSYALLAPILPTLLMDEHRRHYTEMLTALAEASKRFFAESPAVVVVLSARWNAPGPFRVDAGRRHATITDYADLGVEVRHDCSGSPALARALVGAGLRDGVHVAAATRGVDSGVTVPMHFLTPRPRLPVVPLSLPPRAAAECRAWGDVIRRVLAAWPERAAFVVGGGLSRNEHAWNLKREVPEARAFDEWALGALQRGAWNEVSARDPALSEKAKPEAGLLHLEVLRGFLGDDARGTLLCYESGPGGGAALMEFEPAPLPAAEDAAAGGAK
jgi:aromatic ring-opening dioxygenase catalytic subunit (LigB family)